MNFCGEEVRATPTVSCIARAGSYCLLVVRMDVALAFFRLEVSETL